MGTTTRWPQLRSAKFVEPPSAEVVQDMRSHLEELKRLGIEAINDGSSSAAASENALARKSHWFKLRIAI